MNYKRLFVENSMIFVTIVTENRLPVLLKNIDILKNSIKEVKRYYNFDLIAYVVMEDHMHLLIKPESIKDYPKIIHSIKYNFTVGVATPTYKGDLTTPNPKRKIWQNRYYEHTIKDEKDLFKHLDYIHYNPYKHNQVSAKDWAYSSFNEFVKQGYYEENWCNTDDINKINSLNYE